MFMIAMHDSPLQDKYLPVPYECCPSQQKVNNGRKHQQSGKPATKTKHDSVLLCFLFLFFPAITV